MKLDEALAARFARIALGHVGREYPNIILHILESDADAQPPRALHPAFFGSYDWHSCVHGWWSLLTLARMFPAMAETTEITALADATFTAEKLTAELAYFERPSARGFERPYGWAWLLALHAEACRHRDRDWGDRLTPLAHHIAARFAEHLGLLTYPITVGTHFNSAFACLLARDWAIDRDAPLKQRIDAWARNAFAHRADYRGWEPGNDEFLSPALTAALLMREVMDRGEFAAWFDAFLPGDRVDRLFAPAIVSDRSDGKIAHLDGLNLSRAWCLARIAGALPADGRADMLRRAASRHLAASLRFVAGDYMGEHWLATFAILALAG